MLQYSTGIDMRKEDIPLFVACIINKTEDLQEVTAAITQGANVNCVFDYQDLIRIYKLELYTKTPKNWWKKFPNENKVDSIKMFYYRYNGFTPLQAAIINGNERIIKLLVETYKANINQPSANKSQSTWSSGESCLHLIANKEICRNKQKAISLLMYFLKKNVEINAQDDEGNTPLHICVKSAGFDEVADLLLWSGADLTIKDKKQKVPLQYTDLRENDGIEGAQRLRPILEKHRIQINFPIEAALYDAKMSVKF